jgi:hypothetical protein
MDFMSWDIIEDNFSEAQEQWIRRPKWVMVTCSVRDKNGEVNKFSLMYDEFMKKKAYDHLLKHRFTMTDEEFEKALNDYTEWDNHILHREQAESAAGEDL